jgi:hypothetical protein
LSKPSRKKLCARVFREVQKNDIQQVADWTREYADSLDALCDLPEAIEEFVRPERKSWWVE